MDLDWEAITHITKIDPADGLPSDLDLLEHTDLVIVGGSDGVTSENMWDTIQRVQTCVPDLTIFQEPYSSAHVSLEIARIVDFFSIPAVFNGDHSHFVEKHVDLFTEVSRTLEELPHAALPIDRNLVDAQTSDVVSEIATKVLGEGYIIQNTDSAAATVAGVQTRYTAEEVAGAALATEALYGFPIFYVEYSGTYGGPEDVAAAAPYLDETTLLYGGGIERSDQTEEILRAGADAVVVGNCFYKDPDQYLKTIP